MPNYIYLCIQLYNNYTIMQSFTVSYHDPHPEAAVEGESVDEVLDLVEDALAAGGQGTVVPGHARDVGTHFA